MNGGFFALKTSIFDVPHEAEDLVLEPFDRLIAKRELFPVPHDGFWRNMDTFKDWQEPGRALEPGQGALESLEPLSGSPGSCCCSPSTSLRPAESPAA